MFEGELACVLRENQPMVSAEAMGPGKELPRFSGTDILWKQEKGLVAM